MKISRQFIHSFVGEQDARWLTFWARWACLFYWENLLSVFSSDKCFKLYSTLSLSLGLFRSQISFKMRCDSVRNVNRMGIEARSKWVLISVIFDKLTFSLLVQAIFVLKATTVVYTCKLYGSWPIEPRSSIRFCCSLNEICSFACAIASRVTCVRQSLLSLLNISACISSEREFILF